jgi:hypothetical protein
VARFTRIAARAEVVAAAAAAILLPLLLLSPVLLLLLRTMCLCYRTGAVVLLPPRQALGAARRHLSCCWRMMKTWMVRQGGGWLTAGFAGWLVHWLAGWYRSSVCFYTPKGTPKGVPSHCSTRPRPRTQSHKACAVPFILLNSPCRVC